MVGTASIRDYFHGAVATGTIQKRERMERSTPLTPSCSDGRRHRGVAAIFLSLKTSSPILKRACTTSQKR
jgi:hypothetical protein